MSSSAPSEDAEVARLTRELNEAREQQTATAGVLHMISGFPSDVQSILEAIVRTAGSLCEAEYAILFRLHEGKYHVACSNNAAAEFVTVLRRKSNKREQRKSGRMNGCSRARRFTSRTVWPTPNTDFI